MSRKNIITPCTKVCQIDLTGKCIGCKRTREQIKNWLRMTHEERFKIMQELCQK
jgi:predicted Fe-S protein YdhL (DUF1289 family)